MNKLLILVLILICLAFGWHVIAAKSAETDPYVLNINPLTDEVSICLDASRILSNFKDHDAYKMGRKLDEHLYENLGAAILEKHFNREAREHFDLYAVVVPYTVTVTDSPECIPVTPQPAEPAKQAGQAPKHTGD